MRGDIIAVAFSVAMEKKEGRRGGEDKIRGTKKGARGNDMNVALNV